MTDETRLNSFDLDKLLKACPYPVFSDFERENFQNETGAALSRYVIDTVNRIRKIDSDLETETRTFEKNCLQEERKKLVKFLKGQDFQQLEDAITNWEFVEQEYWTQFLGKKAALELLTFGKTTYETMSLMVKLPEANYVKATQICVKLANTIKTATESAEKEVGVIARGNADGVKKKIILKRASV
jgi:hypothetical protein